MTAALNLKYLCLILVARAAADHRACAFSALSPPPPPPPSPPPEKRYRIAVVGGGSSGVFAAATIADALHESESEISSSISDSVEVRVYEATGGALRAIGDARQGGGGGILHDTSKRPSELLNEGYPRGRKEITSLLTKGFPPARQRAWFEDRGVEFRTERDGSVVCSNNGAGNKICDAMLSRGVFGMVETSAKVTSVARRDETEGGFELTIRGRSGSERCDCVVLATGNSRLGHQLARNLGHTIVKPTRSCFAFLLNPDELSSNLQEGGVHRYYSLPHVRLSFRVKVKGRKRPRVHKSEGPATLEVHDDAIILGGGAALSLSSSAAFDLRDANHEGSLLAHFCPDHLGGNVRLLEKELWRHRQENPNGAVDERCPFVHRHVDYDDYDWETESFRSVTNECVPPDLWGSLTEACGAAPGSGWGRMSPKKVRKLAELVVGCPLGFSGRVTASGDPFVNAGGVSLNEVDMSTMRSAKADGLFLCGQVLDGDGSLGGFSFMRDFATGRAAGEGAARLALRSMAAYEGSATASSGA